MITIVNYGCGNIKAIENVYHRLFIPTKVAKTVKDLVDCQKLILPGVGAFDSAMQKLIDSGMKEKITQLVLEEKVPVLGICVGLQLMAHSSEEGVLPGLAWINATVKKFQNFQRSLPLPHMGWNNVHLSNPNPLFYGIENDSSFYFLHSYYLECNDKDQIIAEANYGIHYTCTVNNKNIYGVQFHPEKSHRFGIKLLENFAKLI
ncbi:imidazole glycerol phosphate synthase [Schleiferia thermophila str. Yellowstone]|uniref:imidazole glycerol phosphate synthase subunit HisH n=1 Tax=Schleiferia thermophila TaxID=884107 RepID=UPI0004E77F5B|nr:imidazole glycerol phosphate synthase subunit HisH [Schleiferia thermophila]KFD40146.1 imidazole glycerol phosphate synthase [Schleiferia thermophila str. Yellowstone]